MSGILVAGIGNVFFGDDGFGVEVARRLLAEPLPDGVQVVDYGIRGVHLAYHLLDGFDLVVLVDAIARGEAPGTLVLLEAEDDWGDGDVADPHGMHPAAVLALVRQLGGRPGRTLLVGCEPAMVTEHMGLSACVEQAVASAVRLVRELIGDHGRTAAPAEPGATDERRPS